MNKIISLFTLAILFMNCSKSTTDEEQVTIKDHEHDKTIEVVTEDLQAAIDKKEYDKIIELINNGLDLNTVLKDGLSLLCWAIRNDDIKLSEVLINKGADVNFKTKSGSTPLSIALYRASDELVYLLIDSDINWTFSTNNGYNYFESAMLHERINALHYMLQNEKALNSIINKDSIIVRCIYHWQDEIEDILNILIVHGYKVKTEYPLLYFAIFENKYGILKWFLDYGISPTDLTPDNITPLEFALEERDNIYLRGSDAAKKESDKIVRLLYERIDKDSRDAIAKDGIEQLMKDRIEKQRLEVEER